MDANGIINNTRFKSNLQFKVLYKSLVLTILIFIY